MTPDQGRARAMPARRVRVPVPLDDPGLPGTEATGAGLGPGPQPDARPSSGAAGHSALSAGPPDRLMRRRRLLAGLIGPSAPRIVVLTAPAGSGKTTLLSQLARADTRPAAWLTCSAAHLDPALLVLDLARELADGLGDGPVRQGLPRLAGGDPLRGLTRLVRAMAAEERPAIVVLDDVHRLREQPQAVDVIVNLVDHLPHGWRVAIAKGQSVAMPVARWLAEDPATAMLGMEDLALDIRECGVMLRALGVDASESLVEEVHARTEGWPAGVHLAALALRAQRPLPGSLLVSGDDALIRDFLESEVLAGISEVDHDLLMRTSIVREVNGPLATAITGLPDAGERLVELSRALLLVRPADARGRWFRYHALLGDLLQRQLEDRLADTTELHARAAAWYEAAGDKDAAIGHATQAHDPATVRRLVLDGFNSEYRVGGATTVQRWMGLVTQGRSPWDPQLAVSAGLVAALEGDTATTVRAVASAGIGGVDEIDDAPAGPELDGVSLRAFLCPHGPELMCRDARRALGRHGDDWPWAPLAWVSLGSAERMLGNDAEALAAFTSLERTTDGGVALVRLVARAERAHAAMTAHDWTGAAAILQQDAHAVIDVIDPERIASALWLTADARLRAHRGDMRTAAERLQRAQLSRPRLTWAVPWLAVRSLTEMAKAQLLLGDTGGARTSLSQARDILEIRPNLGILGSELEEVQARALRAGGFQHGFSTLSPAELRLLPLLQTHLTFKEIGERLSISANTVKTEVLSIYGKIGASSRGEAVEIAVEAGMLEDPFAGR